MPHKPLSVCSQPGCPALTRDARCPQHQPTDTRPSAAKRGYDRRHRARRERAPRTPCVDCGKPWEPGMHLDHADGDARNNHPSNLRWRDASCHAIKTAKLDGSFGRPRANRRDDDPPPPSLPVFA